MIARASRLLLLALSFASIAVFAVVSARRLFHPLELDCIEGVILDHVLRLASGRPIYVEPSLQFVPLAYMPLYMTVSAGLVRLVGPELWAPRLVSLVCAWGVAALIGAIVLRETRSRTFALAGAGLYLLGFGFTGDCYDVARPDSMFLMLALAGYATLRVTTGRAGALGAAGLLVLAFFTKQHAALLAGAALAHVALNEPRRRAAFGLALLAGGGLGYLLLARTLGPWFTFYTWDVPAHWSDPSAARALRYVSAALLGTLGVAVVAWLLSLALPSRPWRGPDGLWAWAGLGAIATGLLATLDPYAYRHTLMPTMMAFAILGPLSLHRLFQEAIAPGTGSRAAAWGVACALLALQFVPLVYPVRAVLPRPGARRAYVEFERRLRGLGRGVLVPFHGYYALRAGTPGSLHIIALDDVLRARGNRLLRRDPLWFERMFERLRRDPARPALVTDVRLDAVDPASVSGPLWRSLATSYAAPAESDPVGTAVRPVAGNPFAPEFVYLPLGTGRAAAPAGAPAPGALAGGDAPRRANDGGATR